MSISKSAGGFCVLAAVTAGALIGLATLVGLGTGPDWANSQHPKSEKHALGVVPLTLGLAVRQIRVQ